MIDAEKMTLIAATYGVYLKRHTLYVAYVSLQPQVTDTITPVA